MALIEFNIGEVTKDIEARVEDGLVVCGTQGVSWAADRMRANGSVVTGNLINSLTYSTDKEQGPISGGTKGTQIEISDTPLTVHIGTNVVYRPRVEFGYVGKDSLGRYYNQPAKSYLRAGILANKSKIMAILTKAVRG